MDKRQGRDVARGARERAARGRHGAAWAAFALALLGAGACTLQVKNLEPARQMAAERAGPGNAAQGWQVFQERCAACHGPAATGGDRAPNLLPLMAEVGPRRFASLVLDRYDWGLPPGQGRDPGPVRDAVLDQVERGGTPPATAATTTMPAWAGVPRVSQHIADLHAYLAARAEGRMGPDAPRR
jgi:mono/diheme cytochrome c family protein